MIMNELQLREKQELQPAAPAITTLQILEGAVRGGITGENVAVVERLVALRREEVSLENKARFNRAFFQLKKEISTMEFYADKAAKTKSGDTAYTYCSEEEISQKLEPVLFRHGFTMLFGQRQEADRVVAEITLIHEDGHEEPREYSVRVGQTNSMKDATAVDSGSTTSAWRHLVIKMFGLKSRIRESDDARNIGETNRKVTSEQALELERRAKELNSNITAFLKLGGADTFGNIPAHNYEVLDRLLRTKERAAQ